MEKRRFDVKEYNDEPGPKPLGRNSLLRNLKNGGKPPKDLDKFESKILRLRYDNQELKSQLDETNQRIDRLLNKQKNELILNGKRFLFFAGIFGLIISIILNSFRLTGFSFANPVSSEFNILNIAVFIFSLIAILISKYIPSN